jgi:Flp pilus assembly protein TadG
MLTRMLRLAFSMRRRIRRLSGDDRGVSAVEFGLIAPMMVGLLIGCVAFSQGIAIQRKMTLAAHSVADLVSQTITIGADDDVISIFNAVDRIIEPYAKTSFKITVSQVTVDAQGVAKIDWSDARNTTPRAKDQVVTSSIPATLRECTTTCYLIWGETEYSFVPLIGKVGDSTGATLYLMGNSYRIPTFKDQSFTRPRQVASVTQSAPSTRTLNR